MAGDLNLTSDAAERIRPETDHAEDTELAAMPTKPFVVRARNIGIPHEWTSGKVEDLLDILEGPDRHW